MNYILFVIGVLLMICSKIRRCRIFPHVFVVVQKYKFDIEHVRCVHCQKELGVNHRLKMVIDWDKEAERLHEPLKLKDNDN